MKKFVIAIVSVILLTSFQNEIVNSNYELTGVIRNAPDNSIVLLIIDNKIVDSTLIIGEEFKFIGKVDAPTRIG